MGDFNEIISPTEHSKYDQFTSKRGMRDFAECLHRSGLSNIPACGNEFTWTNRHISKKLDMILGNGSWLQSFPQSIGVFGEPGISDHSICCVFLDQNKPKQKRPFKYFAHLAQHPDFSTLIKECWNTLSLSQWISPVPSLKKAERTKTGDQELQQGKLFRFREESF